METRLLVILDFLYLLVNAAATGTSRNSEEVLNRLLGSGSAKPIVVYMNLENKPRSTDIDDLFKGSGENMAKDKKKKNHDFLHDNDDAYFLYHLLRDFIDADSSSSSEDELTPTKTLLRSALRSRCQQVNSCAQKCPPKKPSCPMNCQEVFDNLNMCPPPPPPDPCTKKPKCGKTMPPSWRF